MSQVIELRDELFTKLAREAEKDGLTPEVWIEVKIMEGSNGKSKKVSMAKKQKAWQDFIGGGDSSKTSSANSDVKNLPLSKRVDKVFGEVVTAKMKRIGLKIPE